jgi:hypothetical protein
MNKSPKFVETFTVATAKVTNSSIRTGDVNYTLLFTAGPNGSKVDKIDIMASNLNGTTSVNKSIYVYIKNGSEYHLIREMIYCNATSVGVLNYALQATIKFDYGLLMSANQELYVGISIWGTVVNNTDFVLEGKNY